MTKLAIAFAVAACGGSVPATHYYALPSPPAQVRPGNGPTLAIETLDAARPYDDDRMIYRVDSYRVDFYEYHRWAAPVGALVADYLGGAFARSGRFRAVARGPEAQGALAISGRVVALEEIDATPNVWFGRVAVSLVATDRATGEVVWTEQLDERVAMPTRSPDGLARAVGAALALVAEHAIPKLAALDVGNRAPPTQASAAAP
ncbi:MAG TPA: ABC-type transport auxiliary lipoprotein family protein [Kofleriaceae bacterium]|nr:ABC-type transport auxiliary lipoprotein family protein [Kofleriaceae bacterium]